MNKSLATINSPQFINLTPLDINPLMSSCEIKVLYVGENRNHSYISKEVATEMAKTLRGAPIVGYWREDVQDFGDHGSRVTLDVNGIKFECLTKPYGFVSPDAKVWFQEFEDINDFGESTIREYLMTTGYLWTGQFEECRSAVEGEGKPHSMELDEKTLDGHWSQKTNGMDFFIINDATFSKLCILGEDVEPCFEGSTVSAPNVSASFALNEEFTQTLFSMMQDLQSALKGGQQMEENMSAVVDPVIEEPAPVVEEPVVEEFAAEPETQETEPAATEEPIAASEEPVAEPVIEEPVVEEPAPAIEELIIEEPAAEEPVVEEPAAPSIEEQFAALQTAHSELQAAYSSLELNYGELQTNYSNLEAAHAELVEFKRQIDDAKKDQMIESFYMLSEDEKAEIAAHKSQYTVEEIEEKLSVICFRKGSFDSNTSSKNNNTTEVPVTFNLKVSGTSKPAWLSAVDNVKNNKN